MLSAHATKRNLSRQEEKALKDLRSDKEIIITRADKGNAVVVLNRTEYHYQVAEMLEDKNTYKVRITDKRHNPASKTDLQQILLKLKASGSLSENEYLKLRPFDSYLAAFYRHFPNSLECTRNNSLKSRRGMKPIEKKCFLCPQNKFGKCLLFTQNT